MTCDLTPSELTDEKRGQILGILSVGCDRQTAANFVGCSLADIRLAMQDDPSFAAGVCRAEATVELQHMRKLQEAAQDVKNWRVSVWWLERRAPERFGPRGPGAVTIRQLKAFVQILAELIQHNISDDTEREQILGRLKSLAASVDQMLDDLHSNLAEAPSAAGIETLPDLLAEPHESFLDSDNSPDDATA